MIRKLGFRADAILVLGVLFLTAAQASAVEVTLSLSKPNSYLGIMGVFKHPLAGAIPFAAQDGVAGTTDYDAAHPSTWTTFQGTITVDVDDWMAPTSIKILSSAANADVSGSWLPEIQPYVDLNGNGEFGEFGPDSLPTAGEDPQPAMDADWGFRISSLSAFAAYRDIVYNVTTPAALPVNALGEFDSTTENFEFATGWLDYWLAAANFRGRAEYAGGDDDNMSAAASTYTVTPLGNGSKMVQLYLPIQIDDMGDTLQVKYDGQFLATAIIPEPATVALIGIAGSCLGLCHLHRRK